MCIRRPDSILFPLALILLLMALVARAVDQPQEVRRPSIAENISKWAKSLKREPVRAPLDPPFHPTGELVYLDLSEKVTAKLSGGENVVDGNTLDDLALGEQQLSGVKFNIIDGTLQLVSQEFKNLPKSIDGIPVKDTFHKLYVLHATHHSRSLADGTLIGKYVVHYEDTTQAEIPIVVGEDVRDWWNFDKSKPVTRGKVAWVGSNRRATNHGYSLRLFVSRWENPRPEAKITHLDYVSENVDDASPFCVAITLERMGEPPVAERLPDQL
jgi:hypothetical protein